MLTGVEELHCRVAPEFYKRGDVESLAERLATKSPEEVDDDCFSQLLEWTGVPLDLFRPRMRVAEYANHVLFFMTVAYLEALQKNWHNHSPSRQRRRCAQLIVDLLVYATANTRERWRNIQDHVFASFLTTCLEWCPLAGDLPRIPFPPFLDVVAEHLPEHFIRSSSLFASLQGYEPSSTDCLLTNLRHRFHLPPEHQVATPSP